MAEVAESPFPLPDFTKELLQNIMIKRALVTLFVSFQLFAIAAGAAVVTSCAFVGLGELQEYVFKLVRWNTDAAVYDIEAHCLTVGSSVRIWIWIWIWIVESYGYSNFTLLSKFCCIANEVE